MRLHKDSAQELFLLIIEQKAEVSLHFPTPEDDHEEEVRLLHSGGHLFGTMGPKVCEYLKPDGTWYDYPDEWDVMTNGRRIGNDEVQAMEKAKELFAKLEKYGFEYK